MKRTEPTGNARGIVGILPALVLVLTLALVFTLAACGNGAQSEPNGSDVSENAADGEDAWVSYTIGVTGYLGIFLSAGSPAENRSACYAVFDTIFTTNPATKEIVSDVLEDWYWEDDTTFVMKLKDGVYFSNGQKATAEDVVYSYVSHDARGGTYLSGMGILFDQCHARDEFTAVMKFEKAYLPFIDMEMYLTCKSWAEEVGFDSEEWHRPVGSGPYACVDYSYDNYIKLQLRDDYWNKEAGEFYVDEWIIKYYPDASTMYMDLELGNILLCEMTTPIYTNYLKNQPENIGASMRSDGVVYFLSFGYLDNPVWKDKNVRLAVAHAVNWEELGQITLGDTYIPANSITPNASPWYVDVGTHAYDPELAKQYLAASGYGPGDLKLETIMFDVQLFKDFTEAVQYYLTQVGVDVSADFGDISAVIGEWITPGGTDFGIMWNTTGSATFDPYKSIDQSNKKEGGLTWTYIDDEHFQELFLDLIHNTNEDEKAAAIREIQQYAFDEALLLPFADSVSVIGFRSDMISKEQINNYSLSINFYQLHKLGLASAWN
jgi:peptide/nickel transport system substrate-binding protein